MAKYRIAFGRIAQESNCLNPLTTEVEDFYRTHYLEGDELLYACQKKNYEAKGFKKNAELSGFVSAMAELGKDEVELIPLISAWAIPGGPLSKKALEFLIKQMTDGLKKAGKVDAIMLTLHGAMGAVGVKDPDAKIIAELRKAAGPKVKIAITLDLHAHLSKEKVAAADIIAAYRTNPHRDFYRCGYRAGKMLLQTLQGKISPHIEWRTLPMVIGGGTTLDFLEPMRPIFKKMKQWEKNPQVIDTSLFMCHLWNNAHDLGWGVYVVTDNNPELANQVVDDLADMSWQMRKIMPPYFPGAEEAIDIARKALWARKFGTVCMSDASDIVGSGAIGENPLLLKAFLEKAADMKVFAGIRDAEALKSLMHKSIGDSFVIKLGAKVDKRWAKPLDVEGVILSLHQKTQMGNVAVVQIKNITLVITEGSPLIIKPSFYTDYGLNIWNADITMVKTFFPFRIYFAAYNRKTLMVRTKGATDIDAIKEIKFSDKVEPFDEIEDWRPTDKKRRLGMVSKTKVAAKISTKAKKPQIKKNTVASKKNKTTAKKRK